MKKQVLAMVLAGAMAAGLAACGSSSDGGNTASSGESGNTGDKVSITIFNSKNELQEDLEAFAEEYGEANNVDIEVYYSQDTVAAHLATKYAANEPYTLNMVDAKDVYSIGKTYGYDLSDQSWVSDTDYAITVDGKVIGFPVCVEARGLLYNADAIKNITGEDFDPSTITTLDDFTAFCDKLVAGGMETPTSILKDDWSLAAHYFNQVYEEREDPDAFVQSLYAGDVDLMNDERFNSLMDTFDALKKYNMWKDNAISVEDAQVHQVLSEGEVAFQFGGNWEWNDIIDYDYTGNIGIMPVPQEMQDAYSNKLVGGGSKFFYIDNSEYTTDAQREAAEGFLNYLVDSDEGKTFVSDTCAMVSPFKSNDVTCSSDIGAAVKQYMDADQILPNYDHDPDDHISIVGASMQKYLADQTDRTGLAREIEDYWKNATPTEE